MYKELFDSSVISQEEFEEKKYQILWLWLESIYLLIVIIKEWKDNSIDVFMKVVKGHLNS